MKITIENIDINYYDNKKSAKEAVVLLHGWGANIQTMIPIGNLLEDKYRVIILDMPGFGMSQEPREVYDSYDYARIVLKILDELDVPKASFIGHSFGGKVSSIIASSHPNRVDKLILIDSAGILPKRDLKYYFKVYSYKIMKKIYEIIPFPGKEKRLENFRKKHGSDDYNNSSGIMRSIMVTVVNEDISHILTSIESESLLIWGEYDDATPLWMGQKFEELIPNSGLVVINGAGHYAYLDDYATFSAVINAFM